MARPQSRKDTDFASVREILESSPVMRLIREHDRTAAIRAAWLEAVGEDVARHTRPTRYRNGTLIVEVFAAPLLLELASFRKAEIIEALRGTSTLCSLVEIEFRGA